MFIIEPKPKPVTLWGWRKETGNHDVITSKRRTLDVRKGSRNWIKD